MKEKIEKICKKIELIHITIISIVAIVIITILYMQSSTKLKILKNEILGTEEIGEVCKYEITQLKRDKNIIVCQLNKKYLENETYHNYVGGEGQNYKINYKILVDIEDKDYEIKTLKTSEDTENIYFSACVKNKKVNLTTKVKLYDVNRKIIFQY